MQRFGWEFVFAGAAVLVLLTGGVAADEPASLIKFEHDLDSAEQRSLKEEKLLVIYFHRESCGWCKKLNREVYVSKRIVPFARRAVFVKLEIDDLNREETNLKQSMRVTGTPTTIVAQSFENGQMQVFGILRGYKSRDTFLIDLDDLLSSGERGKPKPSPTTGRLSSKDANTCDPGDEICKILKNSVLNSIPINRIWEKPSGSKPEVKPADKPKLTHAALGKMLAAAGFNVEEFKDARLPKYGFEEKLGNMHYYIYVAVTSDGKHIWCWANLTFPLKPDQVPQDLLWKLLTRNFDLGPPSFQIDSFNRLTIALPLDGRCAAAEKLRDAVEDMKATVRENADLWKPVQDLSLKK